MSLSVDVIDKITCSPSLEDDMAITTFNSIADEDDMLQIYLKEIARVKLLGNFLSMHKLHSLFPISSKVCLVFDI